MSASLRDVLQTYWGYDSFRPLQEQAMQCVLGHRDSLVVLPTGGGKSLCFQAPAVCRPGLALVVSPLISLMKDQVDALRNCGVPAACINSSLSLSEKRQVTDDIRSGRLRLLYIAPEGLVRERTLDFLKTANLSLIAIDEAHCISEWGHDFRPEYRELRMLKDVFPGVGIHGYTATATPIVREDIVRQLGLSDPEVLVGSFDRPNLIYRVAQRANRMQQIGEVVERHRGESGIIYCISRNNVDSLSASLVELGYKALPYHAGMSDLDRRRNQDAFITEQADIIVATVAFGMGIDKSNVRYVIHAGMPKSLEGYQQESGRAGRDGLDAECCLFYSAGDFMQWKKMLSELPPAAYSGAIKSLQAMSDFCTGVVCRHRMLVEYFGQTLPADLCNACDVCLGDLDLVDDALVVGQKVLSCVVRLKQRFGGDYTAAVLSGSNDKRILEQGHDKLSTWGLLSTESRRNIRDWIEQLVAQGYLEKYGEYSQLGVTDEGRRLLRGEAAPKLLKPRKATKKERTQRSKTGVALDSWDGVDRGLFEALRGLRREKAEAQDVPAYIVFSDVSLRDMARRRPSTLDGFREVQGVGDKKCGEYGEDFVTCIAEYCREHDTPMDVVPADTAAPTAAAPAPAADGDGEFIPRESALRAFEFFRRGEPVEQVARQLDRAVSTTMGYLMDYLRHEQVTDPSPWVDAETVRQIERAAEQVGTSRLTPIFQYLDGAVDYNRIRIVLACLENNGMQDPPAVE